MKEFVLTVLGEPVNLSEYATLIVSKTQNVHVILIEDFSTGMGPLLKEHHIKSDSNFHELNLEDRNGRERLSYLFNVKVQCLYLYFTEAREQHDRHVF